MHHKYNLYTLTKKLNIVIKFFIIFSCDIVSRIISIQIIQAASFIICRARSKANFITKLWLFKKKSNEPLYCFKIFCKTNIISKSSVKNICLITKQILTMIVSFLKTAKLNLKFNISNTKKCSNLALATAQLPFKKGD